MAIITVAQDTLPNWTGYPSTGITLRIFPLNPFIASDGTIFEPSNDEKIYQEIVCTVAGVILTIPQFTLLSTRDCQYPVNGNPKYKAAFYASGVKLDFDFAPFQSFAVPQFPASNTWTGIAIYNQQSPINPVDFTPYNRDEVNYLLSLTFAPVVIAPGATTLDVTNTLYFKTNNTVDTTLSTFTGGSARHLVVIEFADSHTNIVGFNKGNPGDVFLGYWNGLQLLPIQMTFNS